jgi:voltage-gated potassium channel
MERSHKSKWYTLYQAAIVLLAAASVVLALADLLGTSISKAAWFVPVDTVILVLFAIDYLVRFFTSHAKGIFFKRNLFDLIAIIPFNALFSLFRVFRIFRVLRILKVVKLAKLARFIGAGGRLKVRANTFLHTNGLIYIIYLNLASMVLGAVGIYLLEKGTTVQSYGDAIWWAFVTATTVGYGDIAPSTPAGRCIAAALMICGIGLISMLTGTIATYFTQKSLRSEKEEKLSLLKEAAAALSTEQIDTLIEQAHQTKEGPP